MSDQSDDDNDVASGYGYSNRSFISPTARYISPKDDEDQDENQDQYQDQEQDLDQDQDHNYSQCSESEGELAVLDSADSIESIVSFLDDYEAGNEHNQLMAQQGEEEDISVDTMSLGTFDNIACTSGDVERGQLQADNISYTSDLSTICQRSKLRDVQSVSSMDMSTIKPQMHYADNVSEASDSKISFYDDSLSMGSCNSDAVTVPKKRVDALDCISTTSTYDLQSLTVATNRTYNVKSNPVRREDCSSASTCSWTSMYGGALQQADSQSQMVPSLQLNLSTTSSSDSSTYFRKCDTKAISGNVAYMAWVKRKERQKQEKQLAAKMEQQKRDAEAAMRQRLAKERYEEWKRQKEQQQQQQKKSSKSGGTSSASSQINYSNNSINSNSSNAGGQQKRLVRRKVSEADKKRHEEWERMKLMKQQAERERQRLLQISRQKTEEQRKEKSNGAWKNWMKTVNKRAKPVPLNQGFDSLRGTIANIYINPNQWVSNVTGDSRGN